MRFLWLFLVEDDRTNLLLCWVKNRVLLLVLGVPLLGVTVASLGQHVHSLAAYRQIFHCRSNLTMETASWSDVYLSYDIIVFDYGLFHRVLGTTECIANYIDGGFGRSMYCIAQLLSLIVVYLVVLWPGLKEKYWLLTPALIQQSFYSLGMLVLSMATAPKMVSAFDNEPVDPWLVVSVSVYVLGTLFNWFYMLILWHYYWYLEAAALLDNKPSMVIQQYPTRHSIVTLATCHERLGLPI